MRHVKEPYIKKGPVFKRVPYSKEPYIQKSPILAKKSPQIHAMGPIQGPHIKKRRMNSLLHNMQYTIEETHFFLLVCIANEPCKKITQKSLTFTQKSP